MEDLYTYVDPKTNQPAPLLSDDVYKAIKDNAEVLDSNIIYDRDFRYDFFGVKTLERSYSIKIEWRSCRKTSAHVDACCNGNSQNGY